MKNDIFRYRVVVVCAAFFLAGGKANAVETILAFGDSITKGTPYVASYANGARVGGYEPHLENYLANAGRAAEVRNYGLGGETTPQAVNRIDTVLAAHPGADFILILHGSNEVEVGVSPDTTIFDLGVMIDKSMASGVQPVLGTMTPGLYHKNAAHLIPTVYNPAIKDLAGQKGIFFSDLYAHVINDWSRLVYSDGIHPNREGYLWLAQAWFNTLQAIAATPPAPDPTPDPGAGNGNSSNGSDSSASSSGGGGGCFIATAAFGSPLERHVTLLTGFRDRFLLTNWAGKRFVASYYHNSPPLAAWINEHPWSKAPVRVMLIPLVGISWILLSFGKTALCLGVATSVGMLLLCGGHTPSGAQDRKKQDQSATSSPRNSRP